ncbi:hypothetical protein [Pedobacter sp. Leaf132]|uniref:hypothetical protein n=1 Tax=Pedobacter sp. Leaf132 TaxID=2876557 RepID=UPI001E3BB1A3|nr:hypothetical protein [Pedobacter sp. Leaf132]
MLSIIALHHKPPKPDRSEKARNPDLGSKAIVFNRLLSYFTGFIGLRLKTGAGLISRSNTAIAFQKKGQTID